MSPQFEANVSGKRMIRTNLNHICPECRAEHTVTDWSMGERWVCECGIPYYADPAGRVWRWSADEAEEKKLDGEFDSAD